jgi:alpha-glucosidase
VLVGAEDVIKFTLKPRGGAAVRLVPVTEKEAKAYKKYGGESF